MNNAVRLTLIFHRCGVVEGRRSPGPVGAAALEDGVAGAHWCLTATLRVYETLGLQRECLDPPERFLRRLRRTFTTGEGKATAEEVDVARRTQFKWLKDLQAAGVLTKVGRGR